MLLFLTRTIRVRLMGSLRTLREREKLPKVAFLGHDIDYYAPITDYRYFKIYWDGPDCSLTWKESGLRFDLICIPRPGRFPVKLIIIPSNKTLLGPSGHWIGEEYHWVGWQRIFRSDKDLHLWIVDNIESLTNGISRRGIFSFLSMFSDFPAGWNREERTNWCG
jgi:hypothetical protein